MSVRINQIYEKLYLKEEREKKQVCPDCFQEYPCTAVWIMSALPRPYKQKSWQFVGEVCINTKPQSSQEEMSQKVHPNVRPCKKKKKLYRTRELNLILYRPQIAF